MSNFNTRKDRDRNGNPLPHYRINYPSSEGITYIHYRDRSTLRLPRWDATKSPGWWRRLMTTRPRRTANRINVVRVLRGADPDGLSWRTGNRPQIYFYSYQKSVCRVERSQFIRCTIGMNGCSSFGTTPSQYSLSD